MRLFLCSDQSLRLNFEVKSAASGSAKGEGVLKLTPVKLLASFVLVVGGACMAWLAFVVYLSYTLTFFVPVSTGDEIIGNISVLGAIPLIAGAVLLFFDQRQKLGTRLIFSGSVILTAYVGICYARLTFQYMGRLEERLWFVVI